MIRIEKFHVHLDEFNLTDINLFIRENEFFILMGPTGAGKTVLLEAIAGLIPVKSGKILIGDTDVTKLPPERRGISIVYQDYALFPHFTVHENITYGLHFHRVGKQEQKTRLKRLVEQLNLAHLLHRRPETLSGGELQRVSLARALIIEPRVLLLDEPLSALDPGFREEIRMHLKQLHISSGVTFIMVTHDFAEALSLADTAAVIHNGKIEQTGSINDIFERPRSTFVADFVGIKNIFSVEYEKTAAVTGNIRIETGREWREKHGYIAIRPEDIVLSRSPFTSSMRNSFRGRVESVSDRGFFYEVGVRVGKIFFTSLVTKKSLYELRVHEGIEVYLAFKATAIHGF
jgi:molybdate/tungstate transport system ATP-binding protein